MLAGLLVDSEHAGGSRRQAGRAAVAFKVALRKQLHETVFAMAGDRAGVTDAGCGIWRVRIGRRRIAGQAGKESLSEGTEGACARVKGLEESALIRADMKVRCLGNTHVGKGFARISFELQLRINVSTRY
jgi:hypothetical protein